MLEAFKASLDPLLTLFVCMAVGFALRKAHILPEDAGKVMSKLEMYVFCPALSFVTMAKYCSPSTLAARATDLLFAACAMAIAIGVAIPLSAVLGKKSRSERGVYAYGFGFANSGYMGEPLVLAIFTDLVLSYYKIYLLPLSIGTYTWGLAQVIPQKEGGRHPLLSSMRRFLCNPPILALFVGIAAGLSGLGTRLPPFLDSSLESLKACMGPVAMLLVGLTVAGYSLPSLLKNKKVYVATALRLFVMPALIVGALFGIKTLVNLAFGLAIDNSVLFLCFFTVATPFGLNTVIFPEAYGGDPKPGAAMALISHTLCVLTIPLLYACMTLLFGKPTI